MIIKEFILLLLLILIQSKINQETTSDEYERGILV